MRLLIVTQAVDRNDPVLGFFHRWIEEFAKKCEHVSVICLFEGAHSLPGNVRVYSLGKERGAPPSFVYASRFLSLVWRLRREYDAVFVHMNPEYIVIAGVLWRLMGKRIGLWYVHKQVNLKLRIATLFSHVVFTASRESFRLRSAKVHDTGHGIDIDFFTPDTATPRGEHVLSVGRLSPSKRHDLVIRAAALANRELRIAGEGEARSSLESLARSLGVRVTFLGGLSQERLRDEYRKAAYLVHTSETGSLDKVVLEALACDTAVITSGDVFKEFPVRQVEPTPEAISEALNTTRKSSNQPGILREHHSLSHLIPRILERYH